MSLDLASQAGQKELRFLIKSAYAAKIYYVSTGRNAWWSTWAKRYSPGCFHTTLPSARFFCQDRRVQGTVFYISELPAVCICVGGKRLLCTEINSEKPLGQFNIKVLNFLLKAIPPRTMTLEQVSGLFEPRGALWPSDYPKKDSSFVCFSNDDSEVASLEGNTPLHHFVSSSRGSNRSLAWERKVSSIDCEVVRDISGRFARLLKANV